MIKVLGLSLYGNLAASTRYRLEYYGVELKEYGIDLEISSLLSNEYLLARYSKSHIPWLSLIRNGFLRFWLLLKYRQYDLIIIYGELFPFLPKQIERCLINIPYIYDFDDAFYLKYQQGLMAKLLAPFLQGKIEQLITRASAVTAGNLYLKNYAVGLNRNTVFLPTVVDTGKFNNLKIPKNNFFTIGWIGSPSTAIYLNEIIEPLKLIAKQSPIKLIVVGASAPKIPGIIIEEISWSDDTEVELINSFDVGIMPLFNDNWARGKCAFKLIQYMSCGVPVIASRIGANIDVVTPDCGFLVQSKDDWIDAISSLRDDAIMRESMGLAGRQRVLQNYSYKVNAPMLAKIIFENLKNNL
jgi:glycosyltransferase involved in cell wall biosynthesis